MILKFIIPGEPNGQGRPRFTTINGHAKAYDPEKSRNYKAFVKYVAIDAVRKIGWECTDKPIRMTIIASCSIPKSATKKFRQQALAGLERPTKKPDVDNIYKGIADALTGIAYKDDKQIVSAEIYKNYAETAQVEVWVYDHATNEF